MSTISLTGSVTIKKYQAENNNIGKFTMPNLHWFLYKVIEVWNIFQCRQTNQKKTKILDWKLNSVSIILTRILFSTELNNFTLMAYGASDIQHMTILRAPCSLSLFLSQLCFVIFKMNFKLTDCNGNHKCDCDGKFHDLYKCCTHICSYGILKTGREKRDWK